MRTNLRLEYTPLSDLVPAIRNAKLHDAAGIRASILRFGFAEPLTINEATGRLVAGHGRLLVLQQLQSEGVAAPNRIHVKGTEWLVPVVRGLSFASEQEAESYALGANQLTIAGGWDDNILLATIGELAQANTAYVQGLGFNQASIDQALAAYGTAAAAAWVAPTTPTPPAVPTAPASAPAPAPTRPASVAAPPTWEAGAREEDDENEDTDPDAGHGILDPINHGLNSGRSYQGDALTFMRYTIPLTMEESAALEATIEDWVHQTGGRFGFVHNLLKQAGRM